MNTKFGYWLCSFTSDKYVHFIAGLLIAFVVASLDVLVFHREPLVAMAIGGLTGFFAGVVKEVVDFFGGSFDAKDIVATTLGAILGMLMSLL